jgi:hypothetical protein
MVQLPEQLPPLRRSTGGRPSAFSAQVDRVRQGPEAAREERRREEAAQESERKRRELATATADADLAAARQAHDIKTEEIATARAALDQQLEAERIRWDKQRAKLEAAQSRTRE